MTKRTGLTNGRLNMGKARKVVRATVKAALMCGLVVSGNVAVAQDYDIMIKN